MDASPKLPVRVRNKLRAKHYSYRTEQQYLAWILCFILHHGKRHPRDMSGPEVEEFLTHLAVNRAWGTGDADTHLPRPWDRSVGRTWTKGQ